MTSKPFANYVATCIGIAARHFDVVPREVLTSTTKKHHNDQKARRLVWFHLHRQGIDCEMIGKVWGGRSRSAIALGIKHAENILADDHRECLAAMPRLPEDKTTLTPYCVPGFSSGFQKLRAQEDGKILTGDHT